MKKWMLAVATLALAACDGDGCNGGAHGSATKFCQDSLAHLDASKETMAESCKGCCLQEVPYEGRIEDGKCICH